MTSSNQLVAALPDAPPSLALPTVADEAVASEQGFSFVLGHQQAALSLWQPGGKSHPLSIDFASGRLGYRLSAGRARGETLVRACLGKYSLDDTRVLDATAGMGRDGVLLAAAGLQVTLLERHAVMAALLADGLQRAEGAEWHGRVTLQQANALEYLPTVTDFDVVYLDPMFAQGDSRGQVKKALRWMQQLLGEGQLQEAEPLLRLARQSAKRRVVVKRAAKAPPLADCAPTASVRGKAVRFDIYTPL